MSRPRFKITADHIRLIETAAGYGLTEAAIARLVGCSPETFYRRKGIRPDILTALERGKALAALNVGKALYTKAIKGDVPAITWYEKTRQNRSEISRLEHSGPDGSPISISSDVRDRLASRLARLAAGN